MQKALSSAEGNRCRSMAMRAAYLAQDRPDIQYAVKELARCMSAPTGLEWQSLERLGRYLAYRPRLVLIYRPQFGCAFMGARVDTDHAGCLKTRRSTNGGALMHGKHTIKSWASTQSVIALSSGEAEYYGAVKGASVLLGALSLCKDLGIELKGRVHTDSSAAKGMANRRGLGKTRHIDTQYLWVQERLSAGSFELKKEGTDDNVGDPSLNTSSRLRLATSRPGWALWSAKARPRSHFVLHRSSGQGSGARLALLKPRLR